MGNSIISKTKKYYKYVDEEKIEEMLNLFSLNILYFRCDKEIKGIENLRKFYKEVRKIKGKHKIKSIISENNIVTVRGIFEGKGSQGNEIKLSFADFFYFDNQGKINKRFTYLA